jgi:hypothetical protein
VKNYDTSEIWASMPWMCDDKDCPAVWHQKNYWIHTKGKRTIFEVDDYADGCDGEIIDEDDLPSAGEINAAWIEYSKWVLETNSDPLGEFMVNYDHKVKQVWEVKVSRSLKGPCLVHVRRRSRKDGERWHYYERRELPEDFKTYLGIENDFVVSPSGYQEMPVTTRTSWEDWKKFLGEEPKKKWYRIEMETRVRYSDRRIIRQLRKLAKGHLKREGILH